MVAAEVPNFNVGDRVKLKGLKNEKFNGKKGRIIEPLNKDGRYPLMLDSKKGLNAKPGNIEKIVADVALPTGVLGGRKQFYPTDEWNELPPDLNCPPGCEYKVDMKSGKSFVRLTQHAKGTEKKMSSRTETELRGAISWGDAAKVQRILETGGVPSRKCMCEVLCEVASEGKSEVLDKLLAKGGSGNIRNSAKFTPVHFAIQHGHEEVAQKLAKTFASYEDFKTGTTRNGRTIYDYAIQLDMKKLGMRFKEWAEKNKSWKAVKIQE